MQRGDIWTMAGGPHYASKPRPVVIVQNNRFSGTASITICLFSSFSIQGTLFRVPVYPTSENGLLLPSWLEADKLTTVPRHKLGIHIGALDAETLAELDRAIIVFLHLDGDRPARAPRRR